VNALTDMQSEPKSMRRGWVEVNGVRLKGRWMVWGPGLRGSGRLAGQQYILYCTVTSNSNSNSHNTLAFLREGWAGEAGGAGMNEAS